MKSLSLAKTESERYISCKLKVGYSINIFEERFEANLEDG